MSRDRRSSDGLASEVVHVPCPTCGAVAGALCVRGGQAAKTPCHRRIAAACPRAGEHMTQENRPDFYRAWQERPQEMARSYRKAQCEGCGGWTLWIPKGETE